MPSIGDAGGLGKGVEEAGVVGDLVEPAPGSQLGVLTERTHAVAESGPGQNGDVPHQQQGPGRKGPHGGPAGAVQCDTGRLGRKPWRSAGGDDGHAGRGGDGCGFDHAPNV